MSPHDPSLFSLLNSLFEPNFLILVTYLCINLYLAFRVIRIATKRYRQLQMTPHESGELGLVELPADGDDDVMEAHRDLFGRGSTSKKHHTDTPVADAMIRLATWALKNDACYAKSIFAFLAILSLASTWYYMLSFLRHSYLAYLERCHLTSYPLPPAPPPFDLARPALLVPALHLRILRISQWLASLSLFKEAWMEVIRDAPSWWWSSEICIITVGAWALFLRHEGERLRIPHVWTVMALGQLVAISFAFNLFNLAVIYRLEAYDLIDTRSEKTFKAKHRVITPREDDTPPSPPEIWPPPQRDRLAQERPFHVAMRFAETTDRRPAASLDTSLPPTPIRSPDPSIRVISTKLIVQRTPLPPQPMFMDKVAGIMQRCVPERVGMPVFVVAGLSSVLRHPNSFTKVMIMHVFPLLISLYPAYRQPHASTSRSTSSARPPFVQSTPRYTRKQILFKMVSRSKMRLPLWKDAKVYYLGLGIVSIVLRLWLTIKCFFEVDGRLSILHRSWRTIQLLFPTTFLRHPAQSSISSDHVCVALSATVFVLIESGLWLWKAAVASPSSYLPGASDDDEDGNDGGDTMHFPLPAGIQLDKADRKVIETQACAVVALLALSPLLGASATFSLYLAARCTWVEQYERYCGAQNEEMLRPADRPGSSVVEDTEEVELLENEEGERYMEVRKMHVSEMVRPRGGGARQQRAGRATRATEAAEDDDEEDDFLPSPPSSTPSDVLTTRASETQTSAQASRQARASTAESELLSSSQEAGVGRRTTPLRQRHPPARFGEVSPLTSPSRSRGG
ncbi:hypothetical protein PHSY_002614 [Pseudozyma hubeiensis SY62]|uniref:Uncharacterized protein n=1 Tax=Pseudozyma hubeiensis (strain SY62) TaxID=1305764 RepID=R9P1I2_PSEHS|nr:hypothetical protein PHSY_002614 [Pseudozyma hubeiensis SY62]GAC95039.1 hypothetical protein PHSY_002614 [Pseudozyma hubeiensis SY62]